MRIENAVFERHPETLTGILAVSGIDTPPDTAAWDKLKERELAEFRAAWPEYDRKKAMLSQPLSSYAGYYKQFKKTYPVLLQMESVLQKGRGIQAANLGVEMMFLAEVKHGLLVAGHDLNLLPGSEYTVKLAKGGEEITVVSGQKRILKPDDIFLENNGKILSSILEGQDYDTRLTDDSRSALYCAYAVGGVTPAQMREFFQTLGLYIKAALPRATILGRQIAKAGENG